VVLDRHGASIEQDFQEARRLTAGVSPEQRRARVEAELVGDSLGSKGPGRMDVAAAERRSTISPITTESPVQEHAHD